MSTSKQRSRVLALLRLAQPVTIGDLVRENERELVTGQGKEAFAATLFRIGSTLAGLRRKGRVQRKRVAGRALWTVVEPAAGSGS